MTDPFVETKFTDEYEDTLNIGTLKYGNLPLRLDIEGVYLTIEQVRKLATALDAWADWAEQSE